MLSLRWLLVVLACVAALTPLLVQQTRPEVPQGPVADAEAAPDGSGAFQALSSSPRLPSEYLTGQYTVQPLPPLPSPLTPPLPPPLPYRPQPPRFAQQHQPAAAAANSYHLVPPLPPPLPALPPPPPPQPPQRTPLQPAGAAAAAADSSYRDNDPPPNLLLLMFDDMRFDGLSLLRQISLSDSSSSSISSSSSSSRSGGIPSYGAQTPVLDGLIRGGVAMTSAHTMGATEPAVCAPSRAMLLTGKPLWDSHCCSEGCICPGPRNALALDGGATFVKHLRDASEHRYVTHFVGKWHNTQASLMDPLSGFSSASAVAFGGMWPHNEVARAAKDWSGGARQKLTPHRGRSSFSTDLFADAAVDFLRGQQQQQQQQPFCLMVSFTAPHDPRTPPPQWRYTGRLGAYRGRAGPAKESVRAWDAEGEGGRGGGGRGGGGGGGGRGDLVPVPNIFEDSAAWTWDWLRATGEATMRDEGLLPPPHWKLEDKLRAMRKEGQASLSRRGKGLAAARTIRGLAEEWRQYYGLVEQLDDAIGRILRALPRPRSTAAAPAAAAAAAADDDEEEVEAWRENTLVVVTSDHGLGLGAHGWLGKQNLYEHSTKVPLILSGARVHRAPDDRRQRQQRQGWRRDTAVYLHDVGPSLLELLLVAPLPPPRTTTTAATTTTATASAGESSPFTARSFAALVKAPRGSFDAARQYEGRRFIFMAYREIIRAVIDVSTNMKLVEHYDGLQEKNKGAARHTALFNLTSDPFELQNLLVGGEATARRSKAMATQLGKAMATQEHVLRRRVNRGRGT